MLQNRNCKLCIRHKSAKSVCVYGQSLHHNTNIMVIIDKLSYAQNDNNTILIGQGGGILTKLFDELGILDQCYFTAAVKCYVNMDNDKPKVGEIRACNLYLQDEIDNIKPQLIICLGSTAAASIFNKNIPLKDLRQRIFEYKNAKVACTYSHNIVFVEPSKYNQLQKDLKWIFNNLKSKEESGIDYKIELESEMPDSNIYGLDVETTGLNTYKDKLLTVAIANPNNKISIGYNIGYEQCSQNK